ncbi:MAG: cell division topological specificity factor MinE [Nitrospirae bacterium]|nr:cell division topological specificity factor MinE [Nitrospirota bacterium]
MIIDRLRARRGGSARAAKQRLQFVLVHDRAGLSPAKIEAMKNDLTAAISKRVDIDSKRVDITLMRDRKKQRLVADIPLAPRRQRAH